MIKQALIVAMLISTPVFSQITTTGKGTISLEPDMAVVPLEIACEDVSGVAVNEKMNKQVDIIVEKLKELKLAEKDICVTNYNLNLKSKIDNGEVKIIGFVLKTLIYVKVRDIKKLSIVLESCMKNGVKNIGAVRFEVTNSEQVLNKVRELAIEEAKNKAKIYADNLGIKVGFVRSVTERETQASSTCNVNESSNIIEFKSGERSYSIEVTIVFDVRR